jgi:hypothetical protein
MVSLHSAVAPGKYDFQRWKTGGRDLVFVWEIYFQGWKTCESDIDFLWGSIYLRHGFVFHSNFYVWEREFSFVLSFCLFICWFDYCVRKWRPHIRDVGLKSGTAARIYHRLPKQNSILENLVQCSLSSFSHIFGRINLLEENNM